MANTSLNVKQSSYTSRLCGHPTHWTLLCTRKYYNQDSTMTRLIAFSSPSCNNHLDFTAQIMPCTRPTATPAQWYDSPAAVSAVAHSLPTAAPVTDRTPPPVALAQWQGVLAVAAAMLAAYPRAAAAGQSSNLNGQPLVLSIDAGNLQVGLRRFKVTLMSAPCS